jgi:hypothetical protein
MKPYRVKPYQLFTQIKGKEAEEIKQLLEEYGD